MGGQAQVWIVVAIHFLSKIFPFTFQAQDKCNLPNMGKKHDC